ncbi:MAG TPA: HEAT repeat domain-containing protein [Bryobacteraceae bacterium]|nr:HEAT repeat domain-containing protein [Bryobacteraceae bacterium]
MRAVFAALFAAGVLATADAPYPLPPLAGEAKAANMLQTALASKNPDVRKAAVASLSLAGAREPYLTWLEAMIEDKDVPVRTTTITSLVDLKNPRTIPVLQKALHDPTPEVSFAAAKALWTLNDPEGRAALISVLGRDSKTSSNFISSQMRDTLRLFHTPKEMFVFIFKNGIGFAPVPGIGEGVSSLQDILSDAGVSGRAAAALLMSADKTPEVLAALRDALSDKDASVRAAAVHAIAMRGDPAMIETIRPLMDDMKEPVRLRAAAAFLRLAWIEQSHAYSAVAPPKRLAKRPAKSP